MLLWRDGGRKAPWEACPEEEGLTDLSHSVSPEQHCGVCVALMQAPHWAKEVRGQMWGLKKGMWKSTRRRNITIRRERGSVGAEQRARSSQNYQEGPGQKCPWPDAASVDRVSSLFIWSVSCLHCKPFWQGFAILSLQEECCWMQFHRKRDPVEFEAHDLVTGG